MATKTFRIFVGLFVLIFIACLFISCSSTGKSKVEVVAWMGKDAIELPLFNKEMNIQSYNVRIHFNSKYGVTLDNKEETWEKEYDEGSPIKELRELALEESKKIKCTLIIAKERGIIKTVNYDDIQKYDNESLKNAFNIPINESEITDLSIYDRDVFLRFLEIVKFELKKNVRDSINQNDIENYVKNHGIDYLKNYIRISPEDEANSNQAVKDILSDAQKLSVMKDLIQEEKYNEIIDQKVKSYDYKINEEIYNKSTIAQ